MYWNMQEWRVRFERETAAAERAKVVSWLRMEAWELAVEGVDGSYLGYAANRIEELAHLKVAAPYDELEDEK
jgi:hypothetical protein